MRFKNGNSIAVTGYGWEVSPETVSYLIHGNTENISVVPGHDCRPLEYLKVRKTLKFMAKQDRLSVAAAGKAIKMAGLNNDDLWDKTGVYMSVGYIPFSLDDADMIACNSQKNNQFSMDAFATTGYENVNPLLTFACLPNMPAYHLSANFDIHDEYYVTYPETPEMYIALQEAVAALNEKRIDVALVGGVADQDNFLVKNHYEKTRPGQDLVLPDTAGFIVLQRGDDVPTAQYTHAVINEISISKTNKIALPESKINWGAPELILYIISSVENKRRVGEHEYSKNGFRYYCHWEVT